MAEEAGRTIDAVAARLNSVTERDTALSDADRRLAEVVAGAHAVAVAALERLNSIQAEIDTAVAVPAAFAMDTPAGALEFQRFLLSKQHEIVAVVSRAADEAEAKAAALQQLLDSYRTPHA